MKKYFLLPVGKYFTGMAGSVCLMILLIISKNTSAQIYYPYEHVTADSAVMAGAIEISFADNAATEVEDVGSVVLDVEISDPADCGVSVALDGGLTTAISGADFSYTDPSPIIFTSGGPTVYSIDILIVDDLIGEPSENIVLYLTDVTGSCILVSPSTYTLTITDNDVAGSEITFSSAEQSVSENETTVPVTVNISEAADCIVDVQLNTTLTTAVEGMDFAFPDPSPLVFSMGGATSQAFNITVINDGVSEPAEDIVFDLANVSGCTLGTPDQTTIHINDDDNVQVNDMASAGISIFSFNQSIQIELQQIPPTGSLFVLMDESGKIVFRSMIYDKQQTIILNEIPVGLYIAELRLDGKYYQQKIFIHQ